MATNFVGLGHFFLGFFFFKDRERGKRRPQIKGAHRHWPPLAGQVKWPANEKRLEKKKNKKNKKKQKRMARSFRPVSGCPRHSKLSATRRANGVSTAKWTTTWTWSMASSPIDRILSDVLPSFTVSNRHFGWRFRMFRRNIWIRSIFLRFRFLMDCRRRNGTLQSDRWLQLELDSRQTIIGTLNVIHSNQHALWLQSFYSKMEHGRNKKKTRKSTRKWFERNPISD